jgi:hypothetical protein
MQRIRCLLLCFVYGYAFLRRFTFSRRHALTYLTRWHS